MSNRTRQNNKTADRKMESNDSPEIPDRGETSEEPGLPSGNDEGGKITTVYTVSTFHPLKIFHRHVKTDLTVNILSRSTGSGQP